MYVRVDRYSMALSGSLEIHLDVLATRLLGRRFRHIRHQLNAPFLLDIFRLVSPGCCVRVCVDAAFVGVIFCSGGGLRTRGGFAGVGGGGGSTRTTSSMQPMQDILLLCNEISF